MQAVEDGDVSITIALALHPALDGSLQPGAFVGYGLEDVVTDAQAGRLISDYLAPEFKQANYYAGFRSALNVLIPALEGKYQLPRASKNPVDTKSTFPAIILILILFFMLSRFFRGPRSTGYGSRRRSGAGPLLTGMLLGSMLGGRGGGSGGFGGGGFSGGFGGMSGGGGASGGW